MDIQTQVPCDGSLDRYKLRWVVCSFTQQLGIDYKETFSPVVKLATVQTFLSLALSHSWPIRQLNIKNAVLHGTLQQPVYCTQPPDFIGTAHPNYICRLNKALYDPKLAPRG